MEAAGGPGDRWLGHRKMAEREESPDTVLERQERATRLVTPGDAVAAEGKLAAAAASRKVPQKLKPPAKRSSVISRRKTCETSS